MKRLLFGLFVLVGIALLSGCEVPTDFTVNSTADGPAAVDAVPGDGVCETAVEDQCTLRAAVMEANALDTPTVIHLAEGATYTLASASPDDDAGEVGDLDVIGTITIVGHGATIETTSNNALLHNVGTLRVDDVTLTSSDILLGAAAVRNEGNAALADVVIEQMLAADGAVQQNSGSLILGRTTIRDVTTGLSIEGGDALIVNSAIYRTSTIPFIGSGQSVYQTGGNLTLINSTIAQVRRTVDFRCGPLQIPCTLDITGPGIWQHGDGGSATLIRSTVADSTNGIVGDNVTLLGSVVAGNSIRDCFGTATSLGYNHDEDGTCLTAPTTGDLPATPAGLPTGLAAWTAADHLVPQAGSPLLDRIPTGTELCDVNPFDQRSAPRPSGPACDVGAIERQPTDP